MSAEKAIVRTWRVGRFTAELSVRKPQPGVMASAVIDWSPGIPHDLTERDLEKYRAGRRKAIEEIASELGVSVAVLEL